MFHLLVATTRKVASADAHCSVAFYCTAIKLRTGDLFELAAVFLKSIDRSASGSTEIDILQSLPRYQHDDGPTVMVHSETYTSSLVRERPAVFLVR